MNFRDVGVRLWGIEVAMGAESPNIFGAEYARGFDFEGILIACTLDRMGISYPTGKRVRFGTAKDEG